MEDKLYTDKAAPHLTEKIRRYYNRRNKTGNITTEETRYISSEGFPRGA